MNRMKLAFRQVGRAFFAASLVAILGACSSTSERPKPAELPSLTSLISVRQAWSLRIGEIGFPLTLNTSGDKLTFADSAGTVVSVSSRTGKELWRRQISQGISAGVGSDGTLAAVVTKTNELVALDAGIEIWRSKLSAQTYTAPLVAGGRVFVVTADRAVSAYDGKSGRRLWIQQRPGEPLILKQSGVLLAVGDTLVMGQGARLVGLNPGNGTTRWESPVASPRGTNDIERLADLVGRVSREGDVVCARAFQASVGCVNAARGNLLWSQPANGSEGLHGDADRIFGAEADGRVIAWKRQDGQKLWTSERLQYRTLSAPLVLGKSVVIGDSNGLLHFMSREDGTPLSRVATDGSAIIAAPVLTDGALVVATRNGSIYGFLPD